MDGCAVFEAAWAPNIPFPSLEMVSMLAYSSCARQYRPWATPFGRHLPDPTGPSRAARLLAHSYPVSGIGSRRWIRAAREQADAVAPSWPWGAALPDISTLQRTRRLYFALTDPWGSQKELLYLLSVYP
jgi:hypothetical protein